MVDNENDLIRWKTAAWNDPGMVAWYAARMADNAGTRRLGNRIEMNLVGRFAAGRDVLEVGLNARPASIPLLRRGMAVTGIDVSQAGLDEARLQAGELPIELRIGDLSDLAVPDAAFDYLVALNTLAQMSDWREVLGKWRRVLRPAGRMLFGIHSLDHLEAVYGPEEASRHCAPEPSAGQTVAPCRSYARVADLLEWADEQGMRVAAIVPVGAFLGGGAVNHWLRDTLEGKFWWKRLLGWMAEEKEFFNLALFLEEQLVARLTTRATSRFVAVLDNLPDREANRRWRDEDGQRNALLCGDVGVNEMHRIYGAGLADFADTLAGHLRSTRNRYFFFALTKAVLARKPNCDIAALLPPNIAALFEDWQLQDDLDDLASEITDTWFRAPQLGDVFEIAGTALGPGLEYRLTERILKDCFGVFSGVRS